MTTSSRPIIAATMVLATAAAIGAQQFSLQHSARGASSGHRIPLCEGLTIVTAVSDPQGDYESIKKIESITPSAIRLTYSTERARRDGLAGKAGGVENVRVSRTVRAADLASARRYARFFSEHLPETIPGSTAIGVSAAVLQQLTRTGTAELAMPDEGLLTKLQAPDGAEPEFQTSTLQRVENGTTRLSILVNNERIELPVVHATGEFFGEAAEFYLLDDSENPLALQYAVARGELGGLLGELTNLLDHGAAGREAGARPDSETRDLLQVVKISYTCAVESSGGAGAARQQAGALGHTLEQMLSETGRADVYTLYFSFNSDGIRVESEPTLKEIAAVLGRHADWKLSIEGHTDSVASDAFNLDLSRRRAAAVKDALVKRYGIDVRRLTPEGYGESSPKDRNDTLAGRARNRRVELVRQP